MNISSGAVYSVFRGFLVSLELSAASVLGAVLIGLFVGICRLTPVPSLRVIARAYIEFIRCLPITVIMVFIFFAGPSLHIILSPFLAACTALSIYMASYIAEALRSGVNAIPRGQVDAARALGFTYTQIFRAVIIPQGLRTMVAPLGNIIVDLTKNTSVAYTISVMELTGATTNLTTRFAQPYLFFVVAVILYLVVTLTLGQAFRFGEKKVAFKR